MRSFYLSQLSSKDYSYLIVYSCILFAQDTWLKIHTNDRHSEFDRIQENLCMTSLKCRRLLVKIFLVDFLLLPYQWFYRQKKNQNQHRFSHIWQEFSTYPLVDCADTVEIRFWVYPSGKGHLFVSRLDWLVGCIKPTLDMPQLTKYQKSIMLLASHGTLTSVGQMSAQTQVCSLYL